MRAVRVHDYGDVSELKLEEAPMPKAGTGDVLVKIIASTVNPVDCRMRSGAIKSRLPLTFPAILGCDLAGIVSETGPGVSEFKPGDEVFGYCGVQRDGTYAEYIALPAAHVAKRPKSLSMDEAAALALASLTAYVALFEDAKLSSGQSVLIQAAAGGVGSIAVQLAKNAGAKVYATGSAAAAPLIKSLGADIIIDYQSQHFEDVAKNMDVVLDAFGGEMQNRSWSCLRPGGFMACLVTPPNQAMMEQFKCNGARSSARPDGALLANFARMADDGKLRPIIDRVLPLSEIQEAHRLSEAGHTHGKIVLRI